MSTACHMETKGKLLHSRITDFRLSIAQVISTTMYLRFFTAQAQLANFNSLLSSKV